MDKAAAILLRKKNEKKMKRNVFWFFIVRTCKKKKEKILKRERERERNTKVRRGVGGGEQREHERRRRTARTGTRIFGTFEGTLITHTTKKKEKSVKFEFTETTFRNRLKSRQTVLLLLQKRARRDRLRRNRSLK